MRSGILYWSNDTTWSTVPRPKAGDNLTVPEGWNLVIDTDIPPLNMLVIEGNVTIADLSLPSAPRDLSTEGAEQLVDTAAALGRRRLMQGNGSSSSSAALSTPMIIQANYLLVRYNGYLGIGTPEQPCLRQVRRVACLPAPAALFSSGQLPLAISFVQRHPDALTSVISLSMSATIGEARAGV